MRADRMARVGEVIADLTDERLAAMTEPVPRPATRRRRATRCAAAWARSSTRSGSTAASPSATSPRWRRGAASIARTRTCSSARRSTMSGPDAHGFNLSTVFSTVAAAVPDQVVLVWRDRRMTYAEMDARATGLAHLLVERGLGAHVGRDELAGHESGQDHLGIYLHNGNEYLEAMVGALPGPGRAVQRQLPLRRGGAGLPPHRRPDQGAGLPRGVRADARRDPRPAARPGAAHPGRRRVRQRPAARRGRLRGRRRHAGARGRDARAGRRRPLHPLHRRHHRHAQGRAVAQRRHLRHLDGRHAVRHQRALRVVRRHRARRRSPPAAG